MDKIKCLNFLLLFTNSRQKFDPQRINKENWIQHQFLWEALISVKRFCELQLLYSIASSLLIL